MRLRRDLLGITLTAALLVAALYLFSGRAAVYIFAKASGLDIGYDRLKAASFENIAFDGLKVVEKKRGIGLAAKHAVIKPSWKTHPFEDLTIDFVLTGVRFVKQAPGEPEAFDTVSGLVAAPFNSRWTYREIKGRIQPSGEKIIIKDLAAASDDIRLSVNGSLDHKKNALESDLVIYFSQGLTKNIPEELTRALLADEKDGWKSLSVRLAGDYGRPSIQVSGKLFRLNIREVSRP